MLGIEIGFTREGRTGSRLIRKSELCHDPPVGRFIRLGLDLAGHRPRPQTMLMDVSMPLIVWYVGFMIAGDFVAYFIGPLLNVHEHDYSACTPQTCYLDRPL